MTERHEGNTAFEPRDIHGRTVLRYCAMIAAGLVVSFAFVAFLAYLFQPDTPRFDEREAIRRGVRLEPRPAADLMSLQKSAADRLTGYAWIDKDNGRVRIPVKRAMDLLAKRGWPVSDTPEERRQEP
jgi:hypothetical protein